MDDHDLLGRIAALVEKEHELEELHVGQGLDPESAHELRSWRSPSTSAGTCCASAGPGGRAGLDPDDAEVRPEDVVEGYRQ